MIRQEDLKEIQQVTEEVVAKFIKNLPNLIRSRLEAAVAKIIGFENDGGFGKWRK